jgi:hypothetical protein
MRLPPNTKTLKTLAATLLAAATTLSLPTCDKAPTAATSTDTSSSADTAPASRPAGTPLFTLSPQTTAITSPLHPDGTPDYIAALNALHSQGVTPDNNAFTAWLAITGTGDGVLSSSVADTVLAMSGAKPSSAKWLPFGNYAADHGHPEKGNESPGLDEQQQATLRPWKEADFPLVFQFLQDRSPILDQAKIAWSRPRYWCPFVAPDGRSMEDALLPALGITRDLATSLLARATLRAGSGDFDGSLSDLVAANHITTRLSTTSTVIEHLVAAAIQAQTAHALAGIAASGILSADQATRLADAFHDVPTLSIADSLNIAERWSILDSALLVATNQSELLHPLTGAAEFRALQSIDTDAVDWDVVLKALNASLDQELHAFQEPLLEDVEAAVKSIHPKGSATRDLSPTAGESRDQYSARVAAGMVRISFPDLARAEAITREDHMQFLMAQALLAAAHHHAATGHWPNSLNELLPAELPALPIDIYALGGKDPVHYLLTPSGPALYSIGRNRIDDDGLRDAPTHRDDITLGTPLTPPQTPPLP